MKRLLSLFLLLLFSNGLKAQGNGDVTFGDENVWFLLLNHVDLSEEWNFSNEFHIRRNDWMKEQQQLIIRPAINFTPFKGFTASFGYSYVLTSPYGKYRLPLDVPEHNIWEQVTLDQSVGGRVNFSHRFRLENRWIGKLEKDSDTREWRISGYNYANRFRYRLTSSFKIFRLEGGKNIYAHIFDEIWLNLDDRLRVDDVDRNWLYLGMGVQLNDDLKVEVAYLDQWIERPFGHEHNPTIQFTVSYDLQVL